MPETFMNCEEARENLIAEKYVSGRLAENLRERFEQHYFACDTCFAEVEVLQAAKQALSPPVAAAASKSPKWFWALPLAAALLGGLFFWPHRQAETPRVPPVASTETRQKDYAALARFEPPAWPAARFRGNSTPASALLLRARALYMAHDYAGCAESLQNAPQNPGTFYYTGICLLLTGHNGEGATALRHTIAAGDTPFVEEAHFYLAKSLLRSGSVTEARKELAGVIAMHGDLEAEARALLEKVQ